MTSSPFALKPAADECADYYHLYTGQVPDGDILEILVRERDATIQLLEGVPADRQQFRYAEGKWSLNEVVGHILDVEWIFTDRALRFGRGDPAPLPGIDQDVYVAGARFDQRPLQELIEEFRHLRSAGIALFRGFDAQALGRTGSASNCAFTVRSILHIVAGHAMHHVGVLRDRYL